MAALKITKENFNQEVMESDVPVLLDFWAPWCGPCKALTPAVEKVAAQTEGKVKVMKCNVDECQDIAGRYSIMSIPTLLVFNKGEVSAQIVGLVRPDKIMEKLQPFL